MKVIYECRGAPSDTRIKDGQVAVMSFPAWATRITLVADDAVPADRALRDAWVHTGNGVAVDLEKARELVRQRIGANPAIDAAQSIESLKRLLDG
jgi:hypothetical protein